MRFLRLCFHMKVSVELFLIGLDYYWNDLNVIYSQSYLLRHLVLPFCNISQSHPMRP